MFADALLTLAVGLVAGVLSGMFGIGGGIVTTPALRLLLDTPALVAVGTPLPVILPGALAGAWTYTRAGVADVRLGVILGLVGAPVSVLAALATRLVGGSFVLIGTAALIAYAAVDMLVGALRPPRSASAEDGSRPLARPTPVRIATVAAIAGAYSGFFGLGGGFVLVPGINRLLGLEFKRSIATSLVAVAVLAIPGSVTHYLLGNVDLAYAVPLAIGVVPGAWVGARLTLGAGERQVRIAFAVVLVLAGLALAAAEMGAL